MKGSQLWLLVEGQMTMAEAHGKVRLLTSCVLAPCKELGETVGVCSPQHYGKGDRQILGAPGSVRRAERPAPDSEAFCQVR